MIKSGVIGHPIAHSISPQLHNYWLKKYSIAGEYKAYDVSENDLPDFIRNLSKKSFAGCNVTVPHKETLFKLIDEADALAMRVEAVNTIIVRNNKLCGTNTDIHGFSENIKPYISKKNKAVILGAGGAAKAVIAALKDLNFREIIIANRSRAKADNLAIKYSVDSADWNNRANILPDADLLINTTSLGLAGKEQLEIDLSALPAEAVVTDIVYNPLITPLLAAAKARGNIIVDGLGMLIHQAAPGFAAWFGVMPEVNSQLATIRQQLSVNK